MLGDPPANELYFRCGNDAAPIAKPFFHAPQRSRNNLRT
jgi:hypothetical protein